MARAAEIADTCAGDDVTSRELQEAVLPRGPAPGGECHLHWNT
jgi:hypothetical protein